MGNVFHGIPPQLALRLAKEYDLKYFIETGTLVGNTAKWASAHFDFVYTIEIEYRWYIRSSMNLRGCKNVQLIYGHSPAVLSDLLPRLSHSSLIWLDAHWSKDLGYHQSPETLCPVLAELRWIEKFDKRHVILIDDERLFGTEAGWPSYQTIKNTLQSMGKFVTVETDVFVAVPKNGKP